MQTVTRRPTVMHVACWKPAAALPTNQQTTPPPPSSPLIAMEDLPTSSSKKVKQDHLRPWDPPPSRIVRATRGSAGKDRHSKVVTARGLRDRRVRLSVPTAISFYDLQDRLGFDQPSKAVQWLIDAAADAIARLPSLQTLIEAVESDTSSKGSAGVDHVSGMLLQSSYGGFLSGGGDRGFVEGRGTLQSNVVTDFAQSGHHCHPHQNVGSAVEGPVWPNHGSGPYLLQGGMGVGNGDGWHCADLKGKGN